MKRYRSIYMMAAVACLTTACQDDAIKEGTVTLPAEVGEEILFGARAGFENSNPSSTRTAYNGTYTVGEGTAQKTYERIIWTANDKIQIYSPQAHNPADGLTGNDAHSAHYSVVRQDDANTKNNDEAYLVRTEETSLQWGQGDGDNGTHDFYAMYPSSSLFQNTDGRFPAWAEAISMDGTNIGGYIHTEQVTTVTYNATEKTYTASPDMRYAYMVAKTTTTREEAYTEDANGNVKGVSLTFFPIVTAMELELSLPSESGTTVNPVTIAKVMVKGTDIAGSFSSNIDGDDSWQVDGNGATTAFTGTITTGNIKNDEITIWTTYGDDGHPLTLQPGEKLTFTVFMKPTANLENIQIGIASDLVGQNVKYKTLGNTDSPVTVVARKKNVFRGLKLPIVTTNEKLDYSKWMEQLPADTKIEGISLPGTGNSFSYGLSKTAPNRAYYVAQELTFDQQWEAGIRAFEIVTDRADNTSGTGFSSLVVQCGKSDIYDTDANGNVTTTKLTVSSAVNKILNKLAANPYETAMLIFTYQPEGSDPDRHGPAYMRQLVTYINTLDANKLVMFEPTLLLGDYEDEDKNADGTVKEGAVSTGARGKLMIVARPNQTNEKDYATINANGTSADDNWSGITAQITGNAANKLLAVNGCGTGKDKWGARGYTIGGNRAPDISNNASDYIEKYMGTQNSPLFTTYDDSEENNTTTVNDVTITRAPKDNADALKFNYTTNTDVVCWFQEWARVLNSNIYASGRSYQRYEIQWFESYLEKLSNVKTTFDMAVSGKYIAKGYVFINSLCGYLVSSTDPTNSVIPSVGYNYGGDYGNISALSTKLNQDFYEYVNTKRKEMVAPTGIVLMDFVSNNSTYGGAYWLPQIIIANNEFKAGVSEEDPGEEPDEGDTPEGGDEGGVEG